MRRGFYVLAWKYQEQHPLSTYAIANRLVPFSFITAETALSFHNLIPERITTTISMAAFGRNYKMNTNCGYFAYHVAPIKPSFFYYGVQVIKENDLLIYMATPLRALMDYVYFHKIKNADVNFLLHSLRIEMDDIEKITRKEITVLRNVYQSRYVMQFLQNLMDEL